LARVVVKMVCLGGVNLAPRSTTKHGGKQRNIKSVIEFGIGSIKESSALTQITPKLTVRITEREPSYSGKMRNTERDKTSTGEIGARMTQTTEPERKTENTNAAP
jgi:hypothetical protein